MYIQQKIGYGSGCRSEPCSSLAVRSDFFRLVLKRAHEHTLNIISSLDEVKYRKDFYRHNPELKYGDHAFDQKFKFKF